MSHWRVPLLLFVGSLLLQVAWIVSLPPFRGSDEFDHAYRAAEVARGEWISNYVPPQHGRGDLVSAPRDLVEAATPECEIYDYTGRDNCHPTKALGNGMVSVASAAARYNPVFYWVIGTAARPFTGATSLYAMRFTAALLCSAFLGIAGSVLQQWRNPRWGLISLFVAMTPVVVYSTSLPAPNGIEMVAGLTLWVCLLGLTRVEPPQQRKLLHLATLASVPLAGVRALGPLWLGLIVLTCVAIIGVRECRTIVRRHHRSVVGATTIAAAASLSGLLWSLTQGTDSPLLVKPVERANGALVDTLTQVPLWLFQSMGAFPTRNEPAPLGLYAIFVLVFAATAALIFWRGNARDRWGLVVACTCAYAVPFALALLTFNRLGGAWQGRYALPYSIGIPLLAALALTRRPPSHRLTRPLLLAGGSAVATAHILGVSKVLLSESQSSPLSGTSEWPIPPLWLVALLTTAGLLTWAAATWLAGAESTSAAIEANELGLPHRGKDQAVAGSNASASHEQIMSDVGSRHEPAS